MRPVPEDKTEEYASMFRERGPMKFQQCKNKCTRNSPLGVLAPDRKNLNQIIQKTIIPNDELKEFGLMA